MVCTVTSVDRSQKRIRIKYRNSTGYPSIEEFTVTEKVIQEAAKALSDNSERIPSFQWKNGSLQLASLEVPCSK